MISSTAIRGEHPAFYTHCNLTCTDLFIQVVSLEASNGRHCNTNVDYTNKKERRKKSKPVLSASLRAERSSHSQTDWPSSDISGRRSNAVLSNFF